MLEVQREHKEQTKQYKDSDVEVNTDVLLATSIQTTFINPVVILTCSLLFLFQLLLLFLVFGLCVKVIVAVLGKLPLIGLVHQIRGAACEVNAEFLNVDFHDAAVNCHAHLKEEGEEEQLSITKVPQ